ncbi:MAG: hypothetical protein HEQ39_13455 [Rhizobacter sp.]
MINVNREIQQAVLNARKFIGFTKLEHLVHADLSGKSSLDLLQRLKVIEQELAKMASQTGNSPVVQQAKALGSAVATTQEVIQLAWKHHHGKALNARPKDATPANVRATKVIA